MVVAKQAMDLCTSVITSKDDPQNFRRGESSRTSVARTCGIYRAKKAQLHAGEVTTPTCRSASISHGTKPEGGLFLWLSLPHYNRHGEDVLQGDREESRVVWWAAPIYFDEPETNSMRINFSYSTFEQIDEG